MFNHNLVKLKGTIMNLYVKMDQPSLAKISKEHQKFQTCLTHFMFLEKK